MDPVMSSPVRDVFSTLLHDVVLWAMVVTSYNNSAQLLYQVVYVVYVVFVVYGVVVKALQP
jgi:hypothetical protein